jgi:hypothetical protein
MDFNRFGNKRIIPQRKIQEQGGGIAAPVLVKADPTWTRAGKQLIKSPELDAVKSFDGETTKWLYRRCLSSIFKGGIYVLPNNLIEEVDDYLTSRLALRAELVEKAVLTYPERHEEARRALRAKDAMSVYDPKDYPTTEGFRAAFTMSWRYLAFNVPDSLANVRRSLLEREEAKAAREMSELKDECRNILRQGYAQLVDHMVERLKPGEDGKKKTFRDTLVERFREFVALLPQRDITDDFVLRDFVERGKEIMNGIEPEDLRDNDGMRQRVQRRMEEMKQELDGMVIAKPTRKYFTDED